MSIRVRIAPSPTGLLHIGTARTALFNWLTARHHRGAFILRIEDTDRERSTKEFENDILEGLQWLGLTWDEGPLRQSERSYLHAQTLEQLLKQGNAFYCFHTPQEREAERKELAELRRPMGHRCAHAELSPAEREERIGRGDSFVIRFRSPREGAVAFDDIIRGHVEISTDELGDFSVARALDDPLYNLAVVADDHAMTITHVIRGEDHLPNTPKQILIYEAMGWPLPLFAHLPLILGTDQAKLSKRHGATAIREFREEGYLPETMINAMALLGWHPAGEADEKMDVTEITGQFQLKDVQQSPAIFDRAKLDWLNGRWIRSLDLVELERRVRPFFTSAEVAPPDRPALSEVLEVIRDRMVTLKDAVGLSRMFYERPPVSISLLAWKKMQNPTQQVPAALASATKILEAVDKESWRKDRLEQLLLTEAKRVGDGDRGILLWPLRAALSGSTQSPGPHEIAALLGKEETLARIGAALDAATP